MASEQTGNPYQILRLSTRASVEEVIQRSRQLASETMDRDERAAYRRAAEEIRQHPVNRAGSQFWEPPDACYDDEAIERFCDRHHRPPINRKWLAERDRRFVEEDCSPHGLAWLAAPPVPSPPVAEDIPLTRLFRSDFDLSLEPWELFL